MKLYYFYGTMSAGKSLELLAKAHQFESTGAKILLMKPTLDTREYGKVKTRAGLEKECVLIGKNTHLFRDLSICYPKYDYLLVDEVQFLNKEQIEQLWQISRMGVRVFAYGLKTSYKNDLFEATKHLFVMADEVEEIKSKCCRCHKKATTHIKIGGDDNTIQIGDIYSDDKVEVRYESVCQECYYKYHLK